MANAGIDRSNIGPGGEDRALLLPRDPDASARRISLYLGERTGITPAVVISDSFGRPWRYGVVSVCIGASGVPSLLARRGELDRAGRKLDVTQGSAEHTSELMSILCRSYAVYCLKKL